MSLAGLALVSTAVLSAPAIAETVDGEDDAGLWFAGVGIASATILAIVLGTTGEEETNPPPVSP
jgi:hypothetical protein